MVGASRKLAPFRWSAPPDALQMADLHPPTPAIRMPGATGTARPPFVDVVGAAIAAIEALVRGIVAADADIAA
jgi:hypothetical protein